MRKVVITILALVSYLYACGQVTIGSGTPPTVGALLELKNQQAGVGLRGANDPSNVTATDGGFLLPRVQLTTINDLTAVGITPTDLTKDPDLIYKLAGLQVYNIATVTIGTQTIIYPAVYTWNGNKWEPNASAWNQVNNPTLPSRDVNTDSYLVGKATLGGAYKTPSGAAISIQTQTDTDPTGGVNSTKGFMLPRVRLESINNLSPLIASGGNSTEKAEHKGTVVYHVGGNGIAADTYTWNGANWMKYISVLPTNSARIFYLTKNTIAGSASENDYSTMNTLSFTDNMYNPVPKNIVLPETGSYAFAVRLFQHYMNVSSPNDVTTYLPENASGKNVLYVAIFINNVCRDIQILYGSITNFVGASGNRSHNSLTAILSVSANANDVVVVKFGSYIPYSQVISGTKTYYPCAIANQGKVTTDATNLIFWKL